MSDSKPTFVPKRRQFCAGGVSLAALGSLSLSACGGGVDDAGSTISVTESKRSDAIRPAAPRRFVHPGLLHTAADFERMRAKVGAHAEPWASAWKALIANGRSQLNATPRPLKTVIRGGDGQNFAQMYIDIARAYQLALRWKISGDVAYAERAIAFLNAWSSTLTTITGNADRFLAAGIYGYQFANAAEIMRTYAGWAPVDFARFQHMMLTVFYPLNHQFLIQHNGAEITNYWAAWDQCTLASILAIGVLCDREDLYNEALSYYMTGPGNGASSQAVYHVHPGHLGQWQESGRDQGHATLGIGLAGVFCEMAWNQGDDMYGYDNNRFLAGAEYVAKSNLRDAAGAFHPVPYTPYRNINAFQPVLSAESQGIRRPVWEMVHQHYANRRGLVAPYTGLQAVQTRPEGDGGNGDQLGFGTLTFTRDPMTGSVPSGLTARLTAGKVVLSWWGCAHASSYTVKRATALGGPYKVLASGISDLLSYTDAAMPAGAFYYVVTAHIAGKESVPSAAARVVTGLTPHTRLRMDEASGTVAPDASGNGHAGTLARGATWTTGRTGNAVAFDGVAGHASLPHNLVADLADFTVATWVYLNAATPWSRVFDFGSGPGHYMMLTPRNNKGVVRFGITTNFPAGEQGISGNAALPVGQWVHVAVTLSGGTGVLYVNGVEVGRNSALALAPFRLGPTNQNWLGRSQFPTDPWLNGKIDDFRLFHGALSAAELAALMRT
ncbi:LamG-like jellyroll fold domain-containing protein [Massilia pseudoviolaceinigra]|uniref:LamG-like jellyroll fold domain-containing protein n=1 Tax=Massilia pseudoviolaceinigra TaxID=3057165 RepID=UPI0027965A79|nr:LamG-like jellyroll fold domain-containing protein [Massilia sp. CCM 9206]MDQ1921532.1 LamG-like jellyroll fold domain-containing protein [Massilia sp. CCM 9206]